MLDSDARIANLEVTVELLRGELERVRELPRGSMRLTRRCPPEPCGYVEWNLGEPLPVDGEHVVRLEGPVPPTPSGEPYR
jgi:hypothetical protein